MDAILHNWPVIMVVLTSVAWGVRLEGRVNGVQQTALTVSVDVAKNYATNVVVAELRGEINRLADKVTDVRDIVHSIDQKLDAVQRGRRATDPQN